AGGHIKGLGIKRCIEDHGAVVVVEGAPRRVGPGGVTPGGEGAGGAGKGPAAESEIRDAEISAYAYRAGWFVDVEAAGDPAAARDGLVAGHQKGNSGRASASAIVARRGAYHHVSSGLDGAAIDYTLRVGQGPEDN